MQSIIVIVDLPMFDDHMELFLSLPSHITVPEEAIRPNITSMVFDVHTDLVLDIV